MCVAACNRKKNTKTSFFGFQGRSRSSTLVPPERSSAVLVVIRSKSVSIGNRSYARRVNSGKITISLTPSFKENLLTQRHEILAQETRNSTLSYGENRESLSHLGLIRYRDMTPGRRDRQTDRRTDRSAIASTR